MAQMSDLHGLTMPLASTGATSRSDSRLALAQEAFWQDNGAGELDVPRMPTLSRGVHHRDY